MYVVDLYKYWLEYLVWCWCFIVWDEVQIIWLVEEGIVEVSIDLVKGIDLLLLFLLLEVWVFLQYFECKFMLQVEWFKVVLVIVLLGEEWCWVSCLISEVSVLVIDLMFVVYIGCNVDVVCFELLVSKMIDLVRCNLDVLVLLVCFKYVDMYVIEYVVVIVVLIIVFGQQ